MDPRKRKLEIEAQLKGFNVKAKDGTITDDEVKQATGLLDELSQVKEQIQLQDDSKSLLAALADLDPEGEQEKQQKSKEAQPATPGEWFIKHVGKDMVAKKGISNATFSAPEFVKEEGGATEIGPHTSPAGLGAYSTFYDRTIIREYRRRLVLADLLGSGVMTNNNAVTYLVEGAAVEGGFATVAEGGLKPSMHFADPTMETDSLKKIAGLLKFSDEMVEDFGFLVSEINNRGLYLLGLAEEAQLLNGDGTGNNVLGLLNRSGIQTESSTSLEDNPDAIFRASTKVATATGLTADSVVINPSDYQNLRLRKDGNGQYFGGGFFQGEYGNGGIMENPPVWGMRTVVTPMVDAGTVIVGALRQAATVYRKGGIRIESTNSHSDDFANNLITTRIEERVALAVRVPAAVVNVTLSSTPEGD